MREPKEILFIDTETYANKAFIGARNEDHSKIFRIWIRHEGENNELVRELLTGNYIFVTFNGNYFDIPVLAAMYYGYGPRDIKAIANHIIGQNGKPHIVTKPFPLAYKKVKAASHIDLMKVAPQPTQTLKMYGARMNAPTIMENPFHHEADISAEQEPEVERYCIDGDLTLTQMLFKELEKPLLLRVAMSAQYGVDMRSKSDSQMAELVFVSKLGLRKNRETFIPESVRYEPPAYLKFKNERFNEIVEQCRNHNFKIKQENGHAEEPIFLKTPVASTTGKYKMGIGGLHSTHDKKLCLVAGDGWVLEDIDAVSYYPTIILLGNLVPKNLGREFLNEYRGIYEKRMVAKQLKNQSDMDSLRIALNGTFGKTSDVYSPLYSPDLTIYIVLTGQLTLLLLIEWLEEIDVQIVSANTDGIILRYREENSQRVKDTLARFTKEIGFTFEQTRYRAIAMKDVNNYFAIKMDRTIKEKGLYAKQDLRKNPGAGICNRAVGSWLATGANLESTIRSGKFHEFLYARNVNKEGGGQYGGEYFGRVIRWYKTTDPNPRSFTYVNGGAKIARTDNSAALQTFNPAGPLPNDLDYIAYLRESVRIIQDVGAAKYLSAGEASLLPEPKRRKRKKDE